MDNQNLRSEVERSLNQNFEWLELEEGLNTIYKLKSGEADYVLKVHTNENMEIERFNAEPEIYRLISEETNIPSPEIIYEDFSEERIPAFYVMENIEGENAAEEAEDLTFEELQNLFYQYGKCLAEIHKNTSFNEHGLIFKNKDLGTEKGFDSWEESFKDLIRDNIWYVKKEWSNPPDFEIDINDLSESLPDVDPVLLHHDNRLENIILKDENISGFLDWSFTRAGHFEYDLILAEYLLIDWDLYFKEISNREALRDRLFQGYQEVNEFERNSGFEKRRKIYRYSTVIWLMAGLPNWGPENPEKFMQMEKELEERLRNEKDNLI